MELPLTVKASELKVERAVCLCIFKIFDKKYVLITKKNVLKWRHLENTPIQVIKTNTVI